MTNLESPLARILNKIKSNPKIASLLTLATLIISLSTFTNATKNLLSFIPESRAEINGQWRAQVKYGWLNNELVETFKFNDQGETVVGTITFLKSPRTILNGKLKKNSLSFDIKINELMTGTEMTYHYLGRVQENKIDFTMTQEGAFSSGVPVEFTATKVQMEED